MDKVYIFSNGTQYADWTASNCERCVKSVNTWDPGGDSWPTCEVEAALMEAYMDDGKVSPEIRTRAGSKEHENRYVWMCGEVEWCEWWKAEVRARKEDTNES